VRDFVDVTVNPNGSFRSDDLVPGRYLLAAVADVPSQVSGADHPSLRASAVVTVGAADVKDIVLPLQQTMQLAGRVVVAPSSPPVDFSVCVVLLVPVDLVWTAPLNVPHGRPDGTGRFTVVGVTAGRYRPVVRNADSRLRVTSATIGGRPVTDGGVVVQQGVNVEQVVVTVTLKGS
jgi:hypothetical protein